MGYIKIGSGTFCSLFPCFIIFFIGENIDLIFRLLLLVPILFLGFISLNINFEEDGIESKDPSFVVIDEFAGMWIALIISDQLFLIIMSFLLFRFFDITKFLGINKIEKLNGSLGIMLDDIVAGIYTLIIVFFIKLFLV
ncbi:MAG: phosphatidylglycerophosphatase A [Chloroflexota bacterium]|nr:phosphatidylglycerophosphatase A [Chloroflexota bacterium]